MQGDYVADLLIFLLSLMFIIFYMYIFAPVETSQDVEVNVEDNRLKILEENSGLTFLRTTPEGYQNNTFILFSEYHSLSNGESYLHEKSALSNILTNHKNNLEVSMESSYLESIWLSGLSRDEEKQGTPFPVPSSKGVEEVRIKVE